jgi:hypothetical protein
MRVADESPVKGLVTAAQNPAAVFVDGGLAAVTIPGAGFGSDQNPTGAGH